MTENIHSTDGIAEDLIRSMVQIASAELHAKTILEKRVSELENGLIDLNDSSKQLGKIAAAEAELIELAQIRREDMLFLFEMYGSKGDKEKWCTVKHMAMASMTAFEAWQASNNDPQLQEMALKKNKLFIKSLSAFLGVEVTECASCFSDALKGREPDE